MHLPQPGHALAKGEPLTETFIDRMLFPKPYAHIPAQCYIETSAGTQNACQYCHTDGLAKRLSGKVNLTAANVSELPVGGDPKSLLKLPQAKLDAIRRPLLRPLGRSFRAPNRVSLYLFQDGSWVVENFNDQPATVELDGTSHTIKPRSWIYRWKQEERP